MSTSMILSAALFAAEKHSKQRRKDTEASPYINHPLALANLLATEAHIDNPTIICAALLHDTLEDTETTKQELIDSFGECIANIVFEVTDDKSLAKAVRKQEQIRTSAGLSVEAKQVKLADKICNLRDILASPPADWSNQRKRDYFDWASQVVAGMRGVNTQLETLFDELYKRKAEFVKEG